jgi:hypothetical protein
MQQQGRPVEKPPANRPHSTRSTSVTKEPRGAKEEVRSKPPSKVAFGQPIKETLSKLAAKGKNIVEPSGAGGRKAKESNVKKGIPVIRPADLDIKPKVNFSPDKGGGGFSKLAAQGRAGPVVVTYENEDSGNPRRRNTSSYELNGESEYLKVPNANADFIGGDQLDRLLVQARRARVAN